MLHYGSVYFTKLESSIYYNKFHTQSSSTLPRKQWRILTKAYYVINCLVRRETYKTILKQPRLCDYYSAVRILCYKIILKQKITIVL